MIKRIIEVSSASYLSMKNRQLLIQRAKQPTQSLPIEDIGVLILDNTAISYTQAMLNHCLANNTLVILCNQQHLPHAHFAKPKSFPLHRVLNFWLVQ